MKKQNTLSFFSEAITTCDYCNNPVEFTFTHVTYFLRIEKGYLCKKHMLELELTKKVGE